MPISYFSPLGEAYPTKVFFPVKTEKKSLIRISLLPNNKYNKGRAIVKRKILTIISTNNNTKLSDLIAGCYDAKLDEKSNHLAVVYENGISLMYKYYELQNDKWVLLKRIFLVEYDLFFQSYCTKIELVDMNNIKATFNLKDKIGVVFLMENDVKLKDVEETFIITIKDDGKILINGKEKTHRYISDYTTAEDKARISKLKKQREEWLKKKH